MLKIQLGQLKGPEYEVCITLYRYDGLLVKLPDSTESNFTVGRLKKARARTAARCGQVHQELIGGEHPQTVPGCIQALL